jgi:hypothetical protein
MKRAVLIGLGLLMSLALVAPASAFVFVFADIEKTKDVIVTETITITKTATIDVNVVGPTLAAAQALALGNQENLCNTVNETEPIKESLIEGSVGAGENTGNNGIVGVNQASGNMINQGDNVAIAVTRDPSAFANAEASAAQISADNSVLENEVPKTKTDNILGSINNNAGIVGVNQASGNMINQLNNVAVAAGLSGVPIALSEADLGQFNACSSVNQSGASRNDTIFGSVLSNQGIIGVNQSSGNGDQQMTNVSIAVAVPSP